MSNRQYYSILLLFVIFVSAAGCSIPCANKSMYIEKEDFMVSFEKTVKDKQTSLEEKFQADIEKPKPKAIVPAAAAAAVIPYVAEKVYDYTVKKVEQEQKKYYYSTSNSVMGEGFVELRKESGTVYAKTPARLFVYRKASVKKGDDPAGCMMFSARIYPLASGQQVMIVPEYLVYQHAGAKIPLEPWWGSYLTFGITSLRNVIEDHLENSVDVALELSLISFGLNENGALKECEIGKRILNFGKINLGDKDDEISIFIFKGENSVYNVHHIIQLDDCIAQLIEDNNSALVDKKFKLTDKENIKKIARAIPNPVVLNAPSLPLMQKSIIIKDGARQTYFETMPLTQNFVSTYPFALIVSLKEANHFGDILADGVKYAKENKEEVFEKIERQVNKIAEEK